MLFGSSRSATFTHVLAKAVTALRLDATCQPRALGKMLLAPKPLARPAAPSLTLRCKRILLGAGLLCVLGQSHDADIRQLVVAVVLSPVNRRPHVRMLRDPSFEPRHGPLQEFVASHTHFDLGVRRSSSRAVAGSGVQRGPRPCGLSPRREPVLSKTFVVALGTARAQAVGSPGVCVKRSVTATLDARLHNHSRKATATG